ncbi:MAG: hypothetical protein NT033_07645 [Candidatus Omnitrophica bacterium]|nr:hypothetical protein [Candidatus Omnitrophota bacterium]
MFKILEGLNIRIFLLSLWMLFLELFLIRWISTEIRIFAYVSNLALLACFIGIGAGCYFSDKKINVKFSFIMLAVTILAVKSVPFIRITELLATFYDSAIWSQVLSASIVPAIYGVILTLFMFCAIAGIFFPLGQLLGAMFSSSPRIIAAYSINILGNIFGIWIFSLFSFAHTAPIAWLIFSSLFIPVFMENNKRNIAFFVAITMFSAIIISMPVFYAQKTLWTPYQKLDVNTISAGNINLGYTINVNNANYMELLDISPKFINSTPELFGRNPDISAMLSQYEIPYLFKKDVQDVLIVGAGGGNDVAGAIRRNIANIDAVEIDPGIYDLGLKIHPERPYSDRRVHIFIDDARSFFKKTRRDYDVISFGLLDSHTLASNYNNVRLDHYMYTLESFEEARRLLKKDGIMTVAFASTRPWITQRIGGLIRQTFGEEPLTFAISPYGTGLLDRRWVMFVVGNNMGAVRQAIADSALLKNYLASRENKLDNNKVLLTTDDWPYLYLKDKSIPSTYTCIIISILLLFVISARALFSQGKRLNLHFLFLGAAFLLLEFQNISKASLLFGSTWIVNAYMFTAIMLLILCANLYAGNFKIKNIGLVYILLGVSIISLYLVPLNSFNAYNSFFKTCFAALIMNLPIFFAGLIFIESLRKYPHKDVALGSNLLGASMGGLLESLSFITGIKALLIFVFAFYALSYIFQKE